MSWITIGFSLLGILAVWTSTVVAVVLWLSNKFTQMQLDSLEQFKQTRHTLRGAMDMRYNILQEDIETVRVRVQAIELRNAARDAVGKGARS